MSIHVRVLAVLVCIAVLAGCGAPGAITDKADGGADRTVADTAREPQSPVVIVAGEVMLSCISGAMFPASAMEGGVSGLADEAEVAAALKALATEAGIDAPRELQGADTAEAEWIMLGRETIGGTEELLVGVGGWDADGPGNDGDYVTLERTDGGWRAVTWGSCNLAPVLAPGVAWAEMTAPRGGLDPAATSLAVEVYERECTSGRDPEPFLNEPVVVESGESVTVYWTSDSPEGAQTCQGSPPVPRVVQLEQPLGDRALRDGSTWPPRELPGS